MRLYMEFRSSGCVLCGGLIVKVVVNFAEILLKKDAYVRRVSPLEAVLALLNCSRLLWTGF